MKRNKEIFLYLVFGAITTLINILVYNLIYYVADAGNAKSNIIAWTMSVAFAFFTNRKWVFESKDKDVKKEAAEFFFCRVATGLLDLIIMFIAVDILKLSAGIMKLVSNILVIVLNYLLSRLWVFKR